jgi:predicted Zn-dependent peptidase
VAIGDLDPIEIKEKIEKMFSGIKPGEKPGRTTQSNLHSLNSKKEVHINKNSLQTQLVVGYPGVGINDPAINAFKLVNKILGNGVSSRLYKKLRCELHLVYSISSVLAIYEDTGYFAVWTNFNHAKKRLILAAILEEFDLLKKEKICDEELNCAKLRYKRDLLNNYDTDYSFADFLGTSLLFTGKIKELDDVLLEIDSVSSNQIYELAECYFREENLFAVSIGKSEYYKYQENGG